MLNMISNNCSMNKYILVFIVIAMVGFAINEAIVVTAQNNSTNSDRRTIIVTWLETNKTMTNSTPMISISGEEFWKIFEPLLEQSINGSTDSFE
jgi:hypothetical protein